MNENKLPPPTPLAVQAALAETSLRTQEQWDAYQSDTRYMFLDSRSRILRDHIQAVAEELEKEARVFDDEANRYPDDCGDRFANSNAAVAFRAFRARLLGLEVQP